VQAPKDAEPVVHVMLVATQPLATRRRRRRGKLLDAGDVPSAICVFALLQGILLLHKQARYAPQILDIDRLATRGTRSLLLGWGANPRTVDAAMARVAKLGNLSQPIEGAA
jgi:hypothetical protein